MRRSTEGVKEGNGLQSAKGSGCSCNRPPPPAPRASRKRVARGGHPARQGCVRRGGGGLGWDPPPPRVSLWSPAEGGPKF